MSATEQHYPVYQLEFLALNWAAVDKFHYYLYGAKFTVQTDNNPLTYVLTTAKLNATGHWRLAALATYDFDIQYGPGKNNIDADLLSRNMAESENVKWEEIPQRGVKSLCKRIIVTEPSGMPPRYVDFWAHPLTVSLMCSLSNADLREGQQKDNAIRRVIAAWQ